MNRTVDELLELLENNRLPDKKKKTKELKKRISVGRNKIIDCPNCPSNFDLVYFGKGVKMGKCICGFLL